MNSTKCIMISTAAAAVSMLVGWFAGGLIAMFCMDYMVDWGLGEGVLLAFLSPVLAIVFGIVGCVLCMYLLTKRTGKIPMSRAHELR